MVADTVLGIGVGTQIAASYEITGLLGRGGMGAVWAAKHLRLPGKRVAIKVLLGGSGSGNEQALARFRREAEITSRIGHPNIVEVLDINMLADGTPYQVLEFLDGETLAARLQRGRLPLPIILDLVRQIGSALLAAHRAGVVHRDLKPENLFLCPTDAGGVLHDRVKVLDFGISKIHGSQTLLTQEAAVMGTPQYMSPEQANGKNQEVDHRTDVFALGAIVYEMLAGQRAFTGDNLVAVIMDVVQGTPASLATLVPALPPNVVTAVERALAKQPAARFQNVGDFVAALTGRPLETLGAVTAATVAGAADTLAAASLPAVAGTTRDPAKAARTEAAQGGGRKLLLVGGGAALAVAALAAALVSIRRQPAPAPTNPSTAASAAEISPRDSAPPIAVAAVEPARPAEPVPPPPPAKTTEKEPKAIERPASSDRVDRATEKIPPEAAEHLDEAERLLGLGQAAEAVRRARQSFFVKKTTRGWALVTRAFCKTGDLENAKANFRNLPRGAPERARVVRDCGANGIDLR